MKATKINLDSDMSVILRIREMKDIVIFLSMIYTDTDPEQKQKLCEKLSLELWKQ
jgi:hypothetical protein